MQFFNFCPPPLTRLLDTFCEIYHRVSLAITNHYCECDGGYLGVNLSFVYNVNQILLSSAKQLRKIVK